MATTLNLSIIEDGNTEGTTIWRNNTYVQVGTSNGGMVAYFSFDLSGVPADAVIDSATLTLTGFGTASATTLNVYRVTAAWSEASKPDTSAKVLVNSESVTAGSTGSKHGVNVAQALQDILGSANYGVAIGSGIISRNFQSSEHATTSYRPTLSVTYSEAPAFVDVTFPATPATASALMPEATVDITYTPNAEVSKSITADAWKNYAGGTAIILPDSLDMGLNKVALFKPDLTGLDAPDIEIVSATFTFDAETAGVPYSVQSVDSAWTENNGNATTADPSRGALTLPGGTTTATYSSTATNSVDITQLVKEWVAGTRTNHGVALTGSSGTTRIASRENTTQNVPRVVVAYYQPGASVDVPVAPATASVTLVDPSVALGFGPTVATTPATASVVLVEPVVGAGTGVAVTTTPATAHATLMPVVATATTDPNFSNGVEPMTATAGMGEALVSISNTFATTPATADVVITEATVFSTNDVKAVPAPMRASATLIAPDEARSNESDPYYQRLLTQGSSHWFRLDETSGTNADNHAFTQTGASFDGVYNNVALGVAVGPEGRRAVTFNGNDSYVTLPDNDVLSNNFRMEVVFKTAKATQTIVSGTDHIFNMFAGFPKTTGMHMRNGLLQIAGINRDPMVFTARKRVDDNEWHHVVWTAGDGKTSVYIDGKLEFRRHDTQLSAIPDALGGSSDRLDGWSTGTFDPAMYFEGEIMEYVLGGNLSESDVARNYYAVFGIIPNYATPMTATADIGKHKGKGNQKRALGLYYYPSWDESRQVANHWDEYNWTGINIGMDSIGLNIAKPFDMGGYKVFPKSVSSGSGQDYLSGTYYDEVTGEPRYIDATKDIDLAEYDMVFFINTPPRFKSPVGGWSNDPNVMNRLWEDLFDNLRDAIDETGISFWCPQPEVAVHFGVVDRIDVHTMWREVKFTNEQGNATGLFDARGPMINPWNTGKGETSMAHHYYDTHALNRHRVVANVDGLTTHGGYTVEDYFYGRPRDPYDVPFEGWKHKNVENGLQIGDEVFYSQDFYHERFTSNGFKAYNKRRSVISVPPNAVRAGTVVTRENAKHWIGTSEVDNPWKDNATSIIVQPGDSLKGRPVGGKIYVNFMDGVDSGMVLKRQIVPPNSEITNPFDYEDDAKRAWDYTNYRVSKTSQGISEGGSVTGGVILLPSNAPTNSSDADAQTDAEYKNLVQRLRNGQGNLIAISEKEKYELDYLLHYNMIDRGLLWLAEREVVEEGSVNNRVAAMTATATLPEPNVSAQKDVTISTTPAIANATLVKPANVSDPDVTLLVLPMTARATMTGYGPTILVEPMTARAELVENFDMVLAGGEAVTLYLHHADAELYILEED